MYGLCVSKSNYKHSTIMSEHRKIRMRDFIRFLLGGHVDFKRRKRRRVEKLFNLVGCHRSILDTDSQIYTDKYEAKNQFGY